MMRSCLAVMLVLAMAGLAGCGDGDGGGGGETIGCAWFEGSNCYKDNLAVAAACLPDENGPGGTLSADSATCTYADGTEVIFHNPFDPVAMDDDNYRWDVEVRVGGQTCIRVVEGADDSMSVTTAAGEYVHTTSGFTLQLTCPDGTRYKVPNALELFECENMLDILPGYSYSWGADHVLLSLMGGPDGDLQLLDCWR